MSTAPSAPVLARPGRPAGIYVHIPFCARLCPYCDFAVAVRRDIPHQAYADALIAELRARYSDGEFEGRDVTTVYFGGGTPTLLAPEQVARVVRVLRDEIGVVGDEWTFEANPLDATVQTLKAWRDLGFGRMSLGVQSFDDAYLARLGRQHDGAAARDAILRGQDAGFDVSFDLIFGGPQHDVETWESDLAIVAEFEQVDHISAYQLTVEPRTVFAREHAQGRLDLPDDEVSVAMLERLRETISSRGMEQYEVSSYAAEDKRSKHNSHYWLGSEYVGVGVGAHGLLIAEQVTRTVNPRGLKSYLSAPIGSREAELVEPLVHLGERLFTGLRSAWGVNLAELRAQFVAGEFDEVFDRAEVAMARIVAEGWARRDGDVIRPTESGFLFADLAGQWLWDAVDVE